MTIKYKSSKNENVSAWIEDSSTCTRVSAHIMICNNGWQASGAAIYSIDAARAALAALTDFVAELEKVK